jgi:hypothetical protein
MILDVDDADENATIIIATSPSLPVIYPCFDVISHQQVRKLYPPGHVTILTCSRCYLHLSYTAVCKLLAWSRPRSTGAHPVGQTPRRMRPLSLEHVTAINRQRLAQLQLLQHSRSIIPVYESLQPSATGQWHTCVWPVIQRHAFAICKEHQLCTPHLQQ